MSQLPLFSEDTITLGILPEQLNEIGGYRASYGNWFDWGRNPVAAFKKLRKTIELNEGVTFQITPEMRNYEHKK